MSDIEELIDLVLTGQHPKLRERCFVDRIVSVLEDTFGAYDAPSCAQSERCGHVRRWACMSNAVSELVSDTMLRQCERTSDTFALPRSGRAFGFGRHTGHSSFVQFVCCVVA